MTTRLFKDKTFQIYHAGMQISNYQKIAKNDFLCVRCNRQELFVDTLEGSKYACQCMSCGETWEEHGRYEADT